jgi:hypothetical protein
LKFHRERFGSYSRENTEKTSKHNEKSRLMKNLNENEFCSRPLQDEIYSSYNKMKLDNQQRNSGKKPTYESVEECSLLEFSEGLLKSSLIDSSSV